MYASNELVSAIKVLKGIEKSYDSGVELLDASTINTESKQGERHSISDTDSEGRVLTEFYLPFILQ